jgi:excisionase family DNA binding protein
MGKASHKLRALGDVAKVIAAAPSVSAAAKQLGVNRSTIHRWIEAGVAGRPSTRRRRRPGHKAPTSPDAWVRWVRRTYDLSPTEITLLALHSTR